jgi:hypothetical protein
MKKISIKILSIIICIAITAFTLSQYAKLIEHLLSIKYNWLFELLMVVGIIFFQNLFLLKKYRKTIFDYSYKMLLVSLIGSLMLWPLLFINHFTMCNDTVNLVYFFTVVIAIFFIHKNIVARMQLPYYLSYTYILYRFIILLFII